MPLRPDTRLGPYKILGPLGAGGMGEVYRAHDPRLGRDVAIKVLPESVAKDPDRLARLEREARTVAGLNHPNIVVLHSVEEADGVRFLTMELVEGASLTQEIRPGGLPLFRFLELATPLTDALAAAHARGVVHCDLKPANVMVTTEGRVKVLDFGLATKAVAGAKAGVDLTRTRDASDSSEGMGTAAYMAPEQVRGEATDARTDLFALGVVFYELATGRRPFEGKTAADVTSALLRDPPRPLAAHRPDLPDELGRVIARCLEKDPERRIQTAKDVRNELEALRGSGSANGTAAAVAIPSIAVLPFTNRSRDQDDEYFADGITEDVIAQLAKVKTLRVISRSSVMPFKLRGEGEHSIADIAARLQVANVLEGSVRRAGNRVRIVAELVDAQSGRSLWAETYDRELDDIFAIQTDVALHIAAGLQAELSPSERKRIHREPTRDMQAYEQYLRGRHALVRFTRDEMFRSIEHFERAIARDPQFALAHAGIALAYTELSESGSVRRDEAGPRALAAAETAVTLDPELGEAYCARAYARRTFAYQVADAEADFKRALELSPNSSDTYDLYGRMLAGLDRFDEAIPLLEKAFALDPATHRSDLATALIRAGRNEDAVRVARAALELEPNYARLHATLGWALFRMGQTDEGIAALRRAAELAPDTEMWRAQLGAIYGFAGRTDEAREMLRQLEDPSRPIPASPYHIAYIHTGLGDHERAVGELERAYEEGTGAMAALRTSFVFAPLREHPRFVALLKRIRVV